MQILQKRFDLRLACPFLGEGVRSVSMLTYPLTIFNFFVIVNSGLSNVCKINSRLSGVTLLSRNLVLQDCWETGSRSCKLEVTFAIHLLLSLKIIYPQALASRVLMFCIFLDFSTYATHNCVKGQQTEKIGGSYSYHEKAQDLANSITRYFLSRRYLCMDISGYQTKPVKESSGGRASRAIRPPGGRARRTREIRGRSCSNLPPP